MKEVERKTLPDFLGVVNKNRKRFGDMMVSRLSDKRKLMKLSFSKIKKSFLFTWDDDGSVWLLVH